MICHINRKRLIDFYSPLFTTSDILFEYSSIYSTVCVWFVLDINFWASSFSFSFSSSVVFKEPLHAVTSQYSHSTFRFVVKHHGLFLRSLKGFRQKLWSPSPSGFTSEVIEARRLWRWGYFEVHVWHVIPEAVCARVPR